MCLALRLSIAFFAHSHTENKYREERQLTVRNGPLPVLRLGAAQH